MNKTTVVTQEPSKSKSIIWVGVVQALLLIVIALAFVWNHTHAASVMTPFASFMSILPVYAMLAVVPVSIANIILVMGQWGGARASLARTLLLGLSLVLSIGVVATTIWIGFLMVGLINAANQANSI
jgi:hypothetical protein